MAEGFAFGGKELIELGRGDVAALKQGPGVGVGVGGIHLPNVIEG